MLLMESMLNKFQTFLLPAGRTQVLTCQIKLTPGIGIETICLGMHVSNTLLIQRLVLMLDTKQSVTVEWRCSSSYPHRTTIIWTTDAKASESALLQWLTQTLLSQVKWFLMQKISKSCWNRARSLVYKNKLVAYRLFIKTKTSKCKLEDSSSASLNLMNMLNKIKFFHRSSML